MNSKEAVHKSLKNVSSHTTPPPTPGLSRKFKKLEIEEDECICSMRCNEFCGQGGVIPPGVGRRQDTTPPGVPVTPPPQANTEDDSRVNPGNVDECIMSVNCEGNCEHLKSSKEGEGGVNTPTGSVKVAASQSNIVQTETDPWHTKYQRELTLPKYESIPYKASTSRAISYRFSFGNNTTSVQGLSGEGGVNTPTGPEGNIVQDLELEGGAITVPRIVESMVEVASHPEESHHHGGPIRPVQDQTTIPEKGLESVNVCGMRSTGDPEPGERTPTDRNPSLDKSPSMVYGTQEKFGDVKEMVGLWESLERDEEEWLPKEGRRRGGRRVSRRISALLRSFQEGEGEGDTETDRQSNGVMDSELQKCTFIFPEFKQTNSKSTMETIHSKVKVTRHVRNGGQTAVRCDWLANQNLLTNQRQGKRKLDIDRETGGDGDLITKKRRPGH